MKNIHGKKITILGAVRSGLGAAKLAKRLQAIPFVSDMQKEEKLSEAKDILVSEGIEFEFGLHSEKVFDCDILITSPGVPTESNVIQEAIKRNKYIISEIEFSSWFCKSPIIAITGTNGKTTTTSLMNFSINSCGLISKVGGNIGNAFSEFADKTNDNEYAVLEISSFQLDYIDTFKPKFSVIINITPDHLDRYENNFDKYALSKFRISKNQDENDYFIVNKDDEKIKEYENINNRVNKIYFSIKQKVENGAYSLEDKIYYSINGTPEEVCKVSDLSLKGEHNLYNSLAVVCVLKLMGIDNEKIRKSLNSFPGVEHRLEFVREINGVKYINDSKATNVDAVWYALRSFNSPIFLILGGKDKGNDYDQIKIPVKNNVKKIYAIGSSANKVYNYFKEIVPTEIKKDLEDCLISAKKEAVGGDIVLLSPACASFDMFNNYEHRGEVFKGIVNNL